MRSYTQAMLPLLIAASVWLAATAVGGSTPADLNATGDPTGLWWAEGGAAQVEISRCGASLCGQVVWLRSPFDLMGCPLRDVENPDATLRDREVLGLEILQRLQRVAENPGVFGGGHIYDPGNGRTYRATLRQVGPDRLDVRGYVGFEFIGRTSVWRRVGAPRQCTARG
jgi:uncharacterized protein (DUF2147 family)